MNTPTLPYTPEDLEAAASFLAPFGHDADNALVEAIAQMMADSARPRPGHNQPPALSLDPTLLADYLVIRLNSARARMDALLDVGKKWDDRIATGGIADDEILGKAAAFEAQVRGHIKEVDALREADRAPILAAGKTVQAAFMALIDPMEAAANRIRTARTAYLQRKEATARAEREAAAREAAAAAQRLADEAARTADAQQIARAIEAEDAAADAAHAAAATPAELARVRTEEGITSTLRRTLAFDVTDKAKVPITMMQVVDAAVLAAGRVEKDPVTAQPVPGIRFFWRTSAR